MTSNSFPRNVKLLLAIAIMSLFASACSDINVAAGMTEVARANGEREAEQAIREAEEAQGTAADEAVNSTDETIGLDDNDPDMGAADSTDGDADLGDADPDIGDDGGDIALNDGVTDSGTDAAAGSDTQADADDTADTSAAGSTVPVPEEDLIGAPATVAEGAWTVAQQDLGVRIRTAPAGDIMGHILRGDVVATTGRGRTLNNVVWGEVEMADGTLGWMALDLLEAAEGETLSGELNTVEDPNAVRDDQPAPDDAPRETQDTFSTEGLSPLTVEIQMVIVSNRAETLTIFDAPSLDANPLATSPTGAELAIISVEGWRNGEIPFVKIRSNDAEGWVDGTLLDVPQ